MKALALFVFVLCCSTSVDGEEETAWSRLQKDSYLKKFLQLLEPFQRTRTDIVFVLDESGSIGTSIFPRVINFTEMIARHMTVSPEYCRLAVVLFGQNVRDHIYLTDSQQNMCTFLRDLDKINYANAPYTNIGGGLRRALNNLQSGRTGANKVIILLTDGEHNYGEEVEKVSPSLKSSGITVFCVGVGNIVMSELESAATSNDHIYVLDNFDLVSRLNEYLKNDTVDASFDMASNKAMCNSYCSNHHDCCDVNADCYCGTTTGRYECSCGVGFGGTSGHKEQCRPCPIGTYKDKIGNKACYLCPENSTTVDIGSTSIQDCKCIVGHIGNPGRKEACRPVECSELTAPEGGVLIPKTCQHFFGSSCSFKCLPNYCPFACNSTFSGNARFGHDVPAGQIIEPRICLDTGKWSGMDFYCDKITCPALNYPKFGKHNCSKTDFGVGVVCEMFCDKGYILRGSSVRTCMIDRTWTGDETTCEAVKCAPLKTNMDLNLKPKECGAQEMPYQSTCVYTCRKGKSLMSYGDTPQNDTSLGVNYCLFDGKWSNRNVKIFCKDVQPPKLICPSSIKAPTDYGKAKAMVSWTLPQVKDNVDSTLQAHILQPKGVKPPHLFPIGMTKVVYGAIDSAGNNNTCSFTVTVDDDQPPNVDKCPYHIVIQHSKRSEISVVWEEPEFSDNSGNVTILSANKNSGDMFRWGPPTVVTYHVSDPSGNVANCSFEVMVKAYSCDYTEPPANGFLVCDKWTNGQLCNPTCRDGYAFSHPTELVYFCSQRTKRWGRVPGSNPRNKFIFPWADCAEKQVPKCLNISVEVQYEVTTCSDEDLDELKEQFINTLKSKHKFFCPVNKGCNVDNVNVVCKKPKRGIRKRSIEMFNGRNMPSSRRYDSMWRRHSRRQSEAKPVLVISFNVEMENLPSSNDDQDCQNCTSSDSSVKDLYVEESDVISTLAPTVSDTVKEVYHLDDTVKEKFKYDIVLTCKQGAVLENNTCVKCSVGTYFNKTSSSCEVCPMNHYQDVEGSMSCKSCPNGTTTVHERSKKLGDCKGPCEPGSFSQSGLEPCLACPKGSYQDDWSSTTCTPCPHGMTTAMSGSHSSAQCAVACGTGSYSSTGYSPCLLCPIGTYQYFEQQTKCFSCPKGTTTLVVGADTVEYCQVVHFCRDYKPCENGATCTSNGVKYKCKCPPGFSGENCEINNDDCDADACDNNGTCVDGIDTFTCVCAPGYNGTRCEMNIDECLSGPCENGGTCVDLINSYACDCKDGFSGTNCEINIDECATNPCMNGGKCFDMQNSYRCCCAHGYHGYNCSFEVDMCDSDPCVNGGTCMSESNNFTCICAVGYEGRHCEINIDNCAEELCHNGGTCIDGINSTSCLCLPNYYGEQCENKYDLLMEEFCIKFSEPATYDYVLLQNPHHLYGITVAFYMRSENSDIKQRSTPVSYSYYNKKTDTIVDNGLTLYDTNKFVLFLHGNALHTGYVANSDQDWHHYAVTWDSRNGDWSFYVNGAVIASGSGVASGEYLYPGFFVLGQEQDGLGEGFSILESFVGELAEFNVWDYAFNSQEIEKLSQSCGFHGNVISWPLVSRHLHGDLKPSLDFDLCEYIGLCDSQECYCKFITSTLEEKSCEHMVDSCNHNPCMNSHTCMENGESSFCACDLGYHGRLCEYDIDECLVENGGCSHGCSNTNGSYFCTCPENMVLEDDRLTCRATDFCHDGAKVYYNGETWLSSCEECVCSEGIILCTEKTCPNITCDYGEEEVVLPGDCCSSCLSRTFCTIFDNDTVQTFDAMQYRFHGTCTYTMVQDCYDGRFEITIKISDNNDTGKAVELYINCEKISIQADGEVLVNDEQVQLPYHNSFVAINTIEQDPSTAVTDYDEKQNFTLNEEINHSNNSERYQNLYLRLLTAHGIIVQWSHHGSITVSVPDNYRKKICGLCGNFNDNPKDDMAIKGDSLARLLSEFIDSWKTNTHCREVLQQPNLPKVHENTVKEYDHKLNALLLGYPWIALNCPQLNDTLKTTAENACAQLWKGELQKCHKYVNPSVYYLYCIKSSCSCREDEFCFCNSLLYYLEKCDEFGVTITDIGSADVCKTYCTNGMVYRQCGPACPLTCHSRLQPENCTKSWTCSPGCYCPDGTVLHEDYCIPEDQCLAIN